MTNSIPLSALGSGTSAKFKQVGDKVAGKILSIEQRQQTSIDGHPQTFADGSPRMQWVVTLQREDGETVGLYARGGNYKATTGEGESMEAALASAGTAAKVEAIEVGGQLAVVHTGTADLGAGKVAKLYRAQYQPPAPVSVPLDLFSS